MSISPAALKSGSPTDLNLPTHENYLAARALFKIKIKKKKLIQEKSALVLY